MRTASGIGATFANSGSGASCTAHRDSCTVSAVNIAITNVLKSRFPQKTWAHLASILGLQERAAKYRVSNSRAYTVEELQLLIQSEDGLDFLVVLMADAEPKWWWWAKQVMTVASIKRRRAEDEQEILKLETSAPAETGARRRIKGALDANRTIKAGIDRAETALGFQRPDETSRDADASRAGSRISDRPVAQTKAAPRAYAGRGR
jgi:hypothetical protein